jgi:hypothetical protein
VGEVSPLAGQRFTSNRRALDQAPGAPTPSFARTRHHIRAVGSPLSVTCENTSVWSATSGDEKSQ